MNDIEQYAEKSEYPVLEILKFVSLARTESRGW